MLGLIASNNFLWGKGGGAKYFVKKLFFVVVVKHANTWIDRLGN